MNGTKNPGLLPLLKNGTRTMMSVGVTLSVLSAVIGISPVHIPSTFATFLIKKFVPPAPIAFTWLKVGVVLRRLFDPV